MNKKQIVLLLLFMTIKLQANMLLDMAIMLGTQQAANMADNMVTDIFSSIAKSMSSDQKNISNAITAFQEEVQKSQTNNAKIIVQSFSQAQTQLAQKQKKNQANITELFKYIKTATSYPGKHTFMSEGAINEDILFAQGNMYTPQGSIWKNVFAIGDWEYDVASDSFWQMSKQPIYTTIQDTQTHNSKKTSAKAPQNSIFTEYYTQQVSYEITCEITLYQTEYPFFAGVVFNKTRWISGSLDNLLKFRMIGIFANSDDDIGIYFSEEWEMSTAQYMKEYKKNPNVQAEFYPLDQLLAGTTKPLVAIDSSTLDNLVVDPVTYVIDIINGPKTIQVKAWNKKAKEPSDFITITSKNPTLYLYHNLGFMSPGAVAQFNLQAPTDLLFSSTAKASFTKDLAQLLSLDNKAKGS